MDEYEIKDVIYQSVDKGLFFSYFSGSLGCFAIYLIFSGGSWWAIIPCMIFSLAGFLFGRYMALKFLFDKDLDCGVEDVNPAENEEG